MPNEVPFLFCPFCKESFEGVEVCPFHDLPLVPIDKLRGRQADSESADTLSMYDVRYGRGALLMGAAISFLSFVWPTLLWKGTPVSMLHAANEGAHHLWVVPAVALVTVAVLWRYRTVESMRRVRFPTAAFGVLACTTILYTLFRFGSVVGGDGEDASGLSMNWSMSAAFLGLGLIVLGGLFLGRSTR